MSKIYCIEIDSAQLSLYIGKIVNVATDNNVVTTAEISEIKFHGGCVLDYYNIYCNGELWQSIPACNCRIQYYLSPECSITENDNATKAK